MRGEEGSMAGNWFWRAEATAPGRQGEQPRPPVEHAYALFSLGPPARNIVTTWIVKCMRIVDVIALLCDRNVWRKEMLSLV
uniref:Uncharacterized protein n=1 Tax=Oryza glumipatula TaxID=40148 RepID=A0A0E0AZ39_9ORYZ